MKRMHLCIAVLFLIFLIPGIISGQTIQVSLNGNRVTGKPLHWDSHTVALMGRDGHLWTFEPSEARDFRKVSDGFRIYSQSEMRGALMREFGRRFDVSGTGQYLVVHPAGQRDRWAQRFEQLYRSMTHYFTARGFRLNRPQFPFVAVVFHHRSEYIRYLSQNKIRGLAGSLGYYDPTSNRIHLYDVTAGQPDESMWFVNAETIIHEAAHQTAYNIGIHRRFAYAPAWVVEGIGTLFEAKGVWNPRHFPDLRDRVNKEQLNAFRNYVPESKSLDILNMQLASDKLFSRLSSTAYAHAWAMTLYLTEKDSRRYAAYVSKTSRRKQFTEYTAKERLRDFTSVFGRDLRMFDARMRRFIDTL